MIAAGSDERRERLRGLIAASGLQVAAVVELEAAALAGCRSTDADLLLLDLDEDCGPTLEPLLEAVEALGIPVLFNDATAELPRSAVGSADLAQRIGLKLMTDGSGGSSRDGS